MGSDKSNFIFCVRQPRTQRRPVLFYGFVVLHSIVEFRAHFCMQTTDASSRGCYKFSVVTANVSCFAECCFVKRSVSTFVFWLRPDQLRSLCSPASRSRETCVVLFLPYRLVHVDHGRFIKELSQVFRCDCYWELRAAETRRNVRRWDGRGQAIRA